MTSDVERWEIEIKRFDSQIAPIANLLVDVKNFNASFSQKKETALADVANNAKRFYVRLSTHSFV